MCTSRFFPEGGESRPGASHEDQLIMRVRRSLARAHTHADARSRVSTTRPAPLHAAHVRVTPRPDGDAHPHGQRLAKVASA